jgi:uncharacterized protein (TIGR02266 family)
VKDLDGRLQTRARFQALQEQAAAEQSRAAFQTLSATQSDLAKTATQPLTMVPERQFVDPSAMPSSIFGGAAPQPAASPPPVPAAARPVNMAVGPVPIMRPPLPAGAATGPATARQMSTVLPRAPFAAEIDFTSDTNLFVGFSENISEGGLFVATPDPLPLGARVTVSFTLPNQRDAIRCDTQVAWNLGTDNSTRVTERVPGMGLKFVNLTDTDRDRLRVFVALREPLFFPELNSTPN